VSIEARDGVSTGISAADRARTVQVAIDASKGADAIVSPGHVFPLAAQPGGVLVRAGHTEAAVDISRLAGLNPSGVICEIMNDDGTMARLDDLIAFAQHHALRIGTIRDLIAYRRRHDHLVDREGDRMFTMPGGGEWRAISYRNRIDDMHHMVLLKGAVDSTAPMLVRMHSLSLFDDILGCDGPRRHLLQRAIAAIEAEGQGMVVLLRSPTHKILRVPLTEGGPDLDMDLRTYGIGAQILADLDVHSLELLTTAHINLIAVEGWGITIVGQRPIPD
jgi:3,4-dihydroxy 2-butanone 4-phosphate synthase/GTP cyclohydrolase II